METTGTVLFCSKLRIVEYSWLAFVPTLIASVIGVPNREKIGAAVVDLKLGLLY